MASVTATAAPSLPHTDRFPYDTPVAATIDAGTGPAVAAEESSSRPRPAGGAPGLSTSLRVSLLIGALVFVFAVVFGLLLAESAEQAVGAAEGEAFELLIQVVRHTFSEELRTAEFALEALVLDPEVQAAIARGDRSALLTRLGPYFESIRDRVPRVHIHFADGRSLLRLHEPDLWGDDLTVLRPMIEQVVAGALPVSGIEVGVHGPGLRAIRPVFANGQHVGSIEFGMDLGLELLNRLKDRYASEFSMRFFNADGGVTRLASTRGVDLCTTSEETRQRIRLGEPFWLHSCTSTLGVAYYPFRSFDGPVIGYIKAEVDRVALVDEIMIHRWNLLPIGMALIGVATIVAFASLSVFMRPLHSIVGQTRTISDRIVAGDVNVRGRLDETGSDFRHVIGAVNGIIDALRGREVLLQAIVEGIPGIVFYCTPDRTVLWANRRARTGIPNLVGRRVGDPGDYDGFFAHERDLFEMAVSTRCVSHLSACYPANAPVESRRTCWEHTAVPIVEGHTVRRVVRISHDITEKKDAEDQLRALNETLEARVTAETARRRAQERVTYQQSRLASIGELAAGMAHEINQPLSSIGFAVQNVVQAAERHPTDPDYLEGKRRLVQDDIERIRRIIDHVRVFARDDGQDFDFSFAVDDAVTNAVGLVGEQMRAHGIELEVSAESGGSPACGNPYQYEQVVLNLLSNARYAVEERRRSIPARSTSPPEPTTTDYRPRVTVSTEANNGEIRLVVEDNGCGIPPDALPRVFDPFYSTKGASGTGLGLSISFGIVERMGGSIVLEPLYQGTRAVVTVPVDGSGCAG